MYHRWNSVWYKYSVLKLIVDDFEIHIIWNGWLILDNQSLINQYSHTPLYFVQQLNLYSDIYSVLCVSPLSAEIKFEPLSVT